MVKNEGDPGEKAPYHVRTLFSNQTTIRTLDVGFSTETKEDKRNERQQYKLAMISPYIGIVPTEVIEAMLDLDLIPGDSEISAYDLKRKTGEVSKIIERSAMSEFSPSEE